MELITQGFQIVLAPSSLLYIFFGVIFGVVFGAMPGVSATMAVILCITFTYAMSPLLAIAFLVAVYCSAITGGGITAILFKIPGTPASAATTFDGYPMAQRGQAGRALGISLYASAFGGLFASVVMFLLTTPLMRVALEFGSSEQFAVTVFGLGILVFLDKKNMLKTLASGLMGLWIATIGIDYLTSVQRFTFGQSFLLNGVGTIPLMVGMFAVVEVFNQLVKDAVPAQEYAQEETGSSSVRKIISLREMLRVKWTLFRCAAIGTVIGIIPGAGATIASFLGYTTEVKISDHPEKFGTGIDEGIAASETANNAATGGSMVPLLALGIPGGNAAAMIMTALSIHGVVMGPMLLKSQPEFLSTVFASMIVANVLMVFVSVYVAKVFAKILSIPYSILGVLILLLSVIGSFAANGSINDIYIMVGAGIFGYFFNKYKYSHAALVLGMVLGRMCEVNFRRALVLSKGNVLQIFSRPITAGIMLVLLCMFLAPVVQMVWNRSKNNNDRFGL